MRAFLGRAGLFVAVLAGCNNTPLGAQHLQTFSVVATQGAALTVGSGALNGTRLLIPAGALAADTNISVDVGGGDLVVAPQAAAGPVAIFGPAGLHFGEPVQMSLPYTLGAGLSTDQLFVGVWEADGTHTVIPRSALVVDTAHHLVQFSIRGFTSFQCGTDPSVDAGPVDGGPCRCACGEVCDPTGLCVPSPDGGPVDAGPAPDAGTSCDANASCPAGEYCDATGQCVVRGDGGTCSSDCRTSNCGPPLGICPPNDGILCDPTTGNWACSPAVDAGSPDAGTCTATTGRCIADADCSNGDLCIANLCMVCGG